MTRQRPVADRIHENVVVSPEGCWLWQRKTNRGGYGVISLSRTVKDKVHRVSYDTFVGPIPDGLDLDHTCHNNAPCLGGVGCLHRRCCNPAHLEPVTRAVNIARGRTGQNRKVVCANHVLVSPASGGRPYCKECNRRRVAAYLARKAA